jgi:hypothetical protein
MRFEDLTVQQYISLAKLPKDLEPLDKIANEMAIVTGKALEEVELMDVNYIMSKIAFLKQVPTDLDFKRKLRIGFKYYSPSVELTNISVNQMVDFYSLYKNEAQLNELLAVIYRPSNGAYHASNHSYVANKMLSKRIGDVLGAVFFSLRFYSQCEKLIQEYLVKNQELLAKTMDEIQNDKEFQDFLNNGGGSTT